jgi:hypothetical protein
MIIHALEGKPPPIYGDGSNVCDWLRVSDHCDALMSVIDRGRIGERNNVGGGNERSNRDVVGPIRDGLDRAFAADRGLAQWFPSCPCLRGLLPLPHTGTQIDAAKTGRPTQQQVRRRIRGRTWPDGSLVPCSRKFGGAVAPTRRGSTRIAASDRGLEASCAYFVLNANYLRFEAWLYRRQLGLENAVCISLPDLLTSQLLLLDWSDLLHARQN